MHSLPLAVRLRMLPGVVRDFVDSDDIGFGHTADYQKWVAASPPLSPWALSQFTNPPRLQPIDGIQKAAWLVLVAWRNC